MADHIRLVDVRCEQQVAFRIEVNMILVNLHNLRLLAVKQRAFDFVRAFGGSNLDVDCRGKVASLVRLDLFDLQITLFGNAGGVDIVDAVLQNRVQQAFKEGGGERAGFGFSKSTGVFNLYALNRTVGKIDAHSAHALCQLEVRLDDSSDAFRNRCHVHSGHNRTALERVDNAIGYIDSNADLCFNRGSAQMRSLHHIEEAKERIIFLCQRFGRIYVDGSAGDFAGFYAVSDSLRIHAAAASAVDDAHAVLHFGDSVSVEHFFGFLGQRRMNRDVIGFGEQRIQIDKLNANLMRTLFGDIGIVANGGHFHSLHTFGNAAANAANADDAQRFALHLNAVEGFAVPFAFLNGLMRLRDVTRHSHQHSNSVLGSSHGVAFRSVEDNDAFGGSSRNIDIIYADACTADNLQAGGGFNNLFCHLRHAAGYEAVIVVDDLNQFVRLHIRHYVYIKMLAQQCYALFTNIIAYKNFHGMFSPYLC